MKTNGVLTLSPFDGKVKLKKSVSRIYSPEGALIGGVSAYHIYDLNGDKVAALSHVEKTPHGEVRRYEGHRNFLLKDGILTLENGGVLGKVVARKERSLMIPLVAAVCVVLAALVVVVSVLGFPSGFSIPGDTMPELVIKTDEEVWGDEEHLEIFDGKLSPGSKGSYDFVIENPTEYELEYTLSITDIVSWGGRSPIRYRVIMNGAGYVIGTPTDWFDTNEDNIFASGLQFAPKSTQKFIIEWDWPFESGNDEDDTQAGSSESPHYYVLVEVSAWIAGQE